MITTERLNRLTKRYMLGIELGPMTDEEEQAMNEIIAEIQAHPERTYFPSPE